MKKQKKKKKTTEAHKHNASVCDVLWDSKDQPRWRKRAKKGGVVSVCFNCCFEIHLRKEVKALRARAKDDKTAWSF